MTLEMELGGRHRQFVASAQTLFALQAHLLTRVGCSLFREFIFQLLEIKARAFLHWREIDECLRLPGHFLLNEGEAPELVDKPM